MNKKVKIRLKFIIYFLILGISIFCSQISTNSTIILGDVGSLSVALLEILGKTTFKWLHILVIIGLILTIIELKSDDNLQNTEIDKNVVKKDLDKVSEENTKKKKGNFLVKLKYSELNNCYLCILIVLTVISSLILILF